MTAVSFGRETKSVEAALAHAVGATVVETEAGDDTNGEEESGADND